MMRLSRLRVLRTLAEGRQPYLKGMGPVKAWLYKYELMAWDQLKGVVLTDKGRVDMEKANEEYIKRPKHCKLRAWELRVCEKADKALAETVDKQNASVCGPIEIKATTEYDKETGILTIKADEVSPEIRARFHEQVRKMNESRMVVVLPPTDVVPMFNNTTVEIKDDTITVNTEVMPPTTEYAEQLPKAPDWVPPKVEEPTTNLDTDAPMPADELGQKRREKEQVEKAAQLAREIVGQQDAEAKFITEVRVLDAYRNIAVEIGNLGQGIEDVFVGKFHSALIQFNPFIPGRALVFYPSQERVEKLMAGYDVAKALLTGAPPQAVAFDGLADLHERCGEACSRCSGTGNLSRNYTVNDKLCPDCRGTGRKGGTTGGAA